MKENNNDELKEINSQLTSIYIRLFDIDKDTNAARIAIIDAKYLLYKLIS